VPDANELVGECLRFLNGDGNRSENPLSNLISPGDTVLIKPNFVYHERGRLIGLNCLVTHGSILRAVIDYVYRAGGPTCKIIVGDSPLQGADFELILKQTGLLNIQEWYRRELNYHIDLWDFRKQRVVFDRDGFIVHRIALKGDPMGYVGVQLGKESYLEEITEESTEFGILDYDYNATQEHHKPGFHEYLIARSVLNADVVINLPKLKTHQKSAITVSLKNLVGINGDKSWLPHYRVGPPKIKGDEIPPERATVVHFYNEIRRKLQGRHSLLWKAARVPWQIFKRLGLSRDAFLNIDTADDISQAQVITAGAWHGNDTVWRMALDLNKILLYADKDGIMRDTKQRKYLSIVDGIIAGEGNGPLEPKPKHCGVVLAGFDPVAVDVVAATLMGFDWKRIPMLSRAVREGETHAITEFQNDFHQIQILGNDENFSQALRVQNSPFQFEPPVGWRGKIELAPIADRTII